MIGSPTLYEDYFRNIIRFHMYVTVVAGDGLGLSPSAWYLMWMKRITPAEKNTFLRYFLSTLAVFLVAGSIQLGVILENFEPILLVMPVVLSVVMGTMLGVNALLRMRLREANKVKSEFISRMSHELRTPMTSIIGFSQYMRHQTDLGDKYRVQAGKIYNAADYLMGLINDLLDVSKIEAGQIQIHTAAVSIPDVVDECVQMILPLANESDIHIHNTLQPKSVPSVCADRVRIRQVLMNILSNAVKYNHENGSVTIRAESDAHCVRIIIEDTGKGIAEDFIEHIFDYFTRYPAHADYVGGIGIGLAISKNLIELMGGRIGVQSSLGLGTCFWVELPRVRSVTGS